MFVLHCFVCLFVMFYNFWLGSCLLGRISAVLCFKHKITKTNERKQTNRKTHNCTGDGLGRLCVLWMLLVAIQDNGICSKMCRITVSAASYSASLKICCIAPGAKARVAAVGLLCPPAHRGVSAVCSRSDMSSSCYLMLWYFLKAGMSCLSCF